MKPKPSPFHALPLLLALTCLLSACSPKQQEASSARKGAPAITVSAVSAQPRTLFDSVRAYAEVEASVAPEVAAEVAGRVTAILVEEGSAVRAGQPLARLDASNLVDASQAADAEVGRLQALLVDQRATVERNRQLVKQGFIAAAALESSEATLAALDKQLSAARSTAASRQRDAGRAVVVAPLAGVIEQRQVSVGDYVTAGRALFLLNANGSRRLKVAVGGADGDRLHPGQVLLAGEGEDALTLTLDEVRAGIDAQSRARIAYARLPADAPWRVGDAIPVSVRLSSQQALTLPSQAVVERPAGRVVYVIGKDDKVEERRVSVGGQSEGWVEVKSGLAAGETVAVDGAGFLAPGASVRVVQPDKKGAAKPAEARP